MINIEPKKWGRSFWDTMYYVALSYPDEPTVDEKRNVRTFYENLQNVLPCYKCRLNYKMHLEKIPLTDEIMRSRQNLLLWLVDINNEVLFITGKTQINLNDVYNRYMGDNSSIILILSIIIIVVVVICYKLYMATNNK